MDSCQLHALLRELEHNIDGSTQLLRGIYQGATKPGRKHAVDARLIDDFLVQLQVLTIPNIIQRDHQDGSRVKVSFSPFHAEMLMIDIAGGASLFLSALRYVLAELDIGPELSCIEEWASVWELWALRYYGVVGVYTTTCSQDFMEAVQRMSNARIRAME